MRALLDTNVLLDLFLDRQPFVEHATILWDASRHERYEGFVSALTPVNVYYVARKIKGQKVAHQALTALLTVFRVCPLDQEILQSALTLPFKDYEDAVQVSSATASRLDAIVTRDAQDYTNAPLPVFSPGGFIAQLPPISSA